jgi:glycosidase
VTRSGKAAVAALVAALAGTAAALGSNGASGPPTGAALAALSKPPAYSSLASQRIYFVMTDRYANGDPSNDTGGLTGGSGNTGFDPTNTGYFHGGDFKGLTGNCTDTKHGLARIKDLGFTAIWVTPPFGQQTVQGSSAAYHGYWIKDFLNVDPHLGTNQDFGDFVTCAHSLGMKVYLDVVVNHTADVVQLQGNAGFLDPGTIPYRDCHGKVFDPARYVHTKTFPCLSAKNMPYPPFFAVPSDAKAKNPAWLNDPTKYHDRGDIDFGSGSQVEYEQGDFFGLDDLFTEQPAVMNGLAQIYAGWVTKYHVDGFRVDTARHVNAGFFGLWVPKIVAAARSVGIKDFPIFGEVVITDDIEQSTYVRDRGLPSVLDFPFQDAAAGFAAGQTGAKALASRMSDDDYFRGPSGVAPTPPTFLGNHDMGRAAFEIVQHGGPQDSRLLSRVELGYDLMYLLRGAPVVYYGDEVGMIGTGGDQQARQDMFPTQVAEWKTQPRVGSPPIGNGSSFDVTSPIEAELRSLAALRDAHPALATGSTIPRLAAKNLYAVSRIDRSARREYVVAFNSGTGAAKVSIATATPSSSWTLLLGSTAPVKSSSAGKLAFTVPPLSAVVLRADTDLPKRNAPKPALKFGADPLSGNLKVASVKLTTADPLSVSFAVRRGPGGWHRLATDDSPPYRAFLEPGRYRKGEKISLVAVATASDGSVAVSPVLRATPRR